MTNDDFQCYWFDFLFYLLNKAVKFSNFDLRKIV